MAHLIKLGSMVMSDEQALRIDFELSTKLLSTEPLGNQHV